MKKLIGFFIVFVFIASPVFATSKQEVIERNAFHVISKEYYKANPDISWKIFRTAISLIDLKNRTSKELANKKQKSNGYLSVISDIVDQIYERDYHDYKEISELIRIADNRTFSNMIIPMLMLEEKNDNQLLEITKITDYDIETCFLAMGHLTSKVSVKDIEVIFKKTNYDEDVVREGFKIFLEK